MQRGDMLLRAVTPECMLEEGDVLHFTGLVESIREVCLEFGLPATHEYEESLEKKKAFVHSEGGVVSVALVENLRGEGISLRIPRDSKKAGPAMKR
jgi:hypothetical protein